jgi:hypothetical protein
MFHPGDVILAGGLAFIFTWGLLASFPQALAQPATIATPAKP